MKLGLQIIRFDWGSRQIIGPKLLEIARAADDANFASLWVMDHYFQMAMLDAADAPMLEAYSALNFMAAVTRRVRLGAMVTGVVYRHPGFLIKAVTTLDVLSGGRAYLGIGAAWYEQEARGLGFPFPAIAERFERLEETLQIAKQMWRGDRKPFNGKHYQLAEPISSPTPLSQPHPPILIGGGGEKKTLRLVAQYGDACNFFARTGNAEIARKLDVLKRHCDAVGRDFNTIERTVLSQIDMTQGRTSVSNLIKTCRDLAGIGIQHFIFSISNVQDIKPIEIIGREVIPAVAEL